MSTEPDTDDSRGWDATRRRVLDRDGHACRFCGIDGDDHRDEYGQGLHAHHVVPKRDGGPDRPENLITVCESCHRTLEDTHAKAVSQLQQQEEHTDAVATASHAYHKCDVAAGKVEDALTEYVDGHPTFAREFGIGVKEDGAVVASEFAGAGSVHGSPRVRTEWDFAVAWGYKEALIDVLCMLQDGPGALPDGDTLADSDLPDPRTENDA